MFISMFILIRSSFARVLDANLQRSCVEKVFPLWDETVWIQQSNALNHWIWVQIAIDTLNFGSWRSCWRTFRCQLNKTPSAPKQQFFKGKVRISMNFHWNDWTYHNDETAGFDSLRHAQFSHIAAGGDRFSSQGSHPVIEPSVDMWGSQTLCFPDCKQWY